MFFNLYSPSVNLLMLVIEYPRSSLIFGTFFSTRYIRLSTLDFFDFLYDLYFLWHVFISYKLPSSFLNCVNSFRSNFKVYPVASEGFHYTFLFEYNSLPFYSLLTPCHPFLRRMCFYLIVFLLSLLLRLFHKLHFYWFLLRFNYRLWFDVRYLKYTKGSSTYNFGIYTNINL